METQTQMHRMDPQFYIDTMLNVDTNTNIKCEHTMTHDITGKHISLIGIITIKEPDSVADLGAGIPLLSIILCSLQMST